MKGVVVNSLAILKDNIIKALGFTPASQASVDAIKSITDAKIDEICK